MSGILRFHDVLICPRYMHIFFPSPIPIPIPVFPASSRYLAYLLHPNLLIFLSSVPNTYLSMYDRLISLLMICSILFACV